jgi:cytochrome oxidase assembly protein ShyY1
MPVFLYNFLAIAIGLLFLAGLALGVWQLFKEGWKHIVIKELRVHMDGVGQTANGIFSGSSPLRTSCSSRL